MENNVDVKEKQERENRTFLSFHTTLLFGLLLAGVVIGSIVTVRFDVFGGNQYVPNILSGLPVPENGMLNCFATYLFNIFVWSIVK